MRSRKFWILTCATALVFGVAVLLSPASAPGAVAAGDSAIALAFSADPEDCHTCDSCQGQGHFVEADEDRGTRAGPAHGCEEQQGHTCPAGHPVDSCNPTVDLQHVLERARLAAIEGSFDPLDSLKGAGAELVAFNADRNSIQVWRCDRSGILANLPLGKPVATETP